MRRLVPALFFLIVAALFVAQTGLRVVDNGEPLKGVGVSASSSSGKPTSSPNLATSIGTTALAFPALTGRVVDSASMLSQSEKQELEGLFAAFEAKSSDQIVVATLPTLAGENLEDYANRLFRHWQLGQAGENNGVLFLIARDDRKLRIEVGYGLEGTLTDALSKIIISQIVVPQFKAGNFGAGILEGSKMILKVLSGDSAELEARKNRNPVAEPVNWEFWIFITLWGIIFFGPMGFAILAPVFGEKIGKGRYRWLGIETSTSSGSGRRSSGGYSSGGWSGGSSGGGFSGGGGSSGGGGASGGW